MKLKILIMLFFFTFLITENCYSFSSAVIKKANKVRPVKKSKAKKIINNETKCSINIQTKIPFKIEELRKFFPDSVLKTEASAPSSGRRNGKLGQITTCAVEYALSRKTYFTLTLNDYGSYDNIPSDELRDYLVLPKAFDKTTEAYNINCGDGYKMWQEKSNSGEISFLYCYRFVLKFEIIDWDKSLPKFEEFVKFFNLDKLVEESKRRLNR
ncbi:MAG: hypothetical protein HZB41_15090 [Ignavibacteriae bacterium]|nr:hypothetical protein [Ignavibacteriota bacterium]